MNYDERVLSDFVTDLRDISISEYEDLYDESKNFKSIQWADNRTTPRCLFDGLDRDMPMHLSCSCPKCTPRY